MRHYVLFLFAKLKPYDHAGTKGTVELTINTFHKREESKHKQNREKITEYCACLLRPFNETLKHDFPTCTYIPSR